LTTYSILLTDEPKGSTPPEEGQWVTCRTVEEVKAVMLLSVAPDELWIRRGRTTVVRRHPTLRDLESL
jgi:hypothetical protein